MSLTLDVDLTIRGTVTIRNHDTTHKHRAQEEAAGNDAHLETFAERKKASRIVAGRMRQAGYERRGTAMHTCGDWLEIAECPTGDHRHVRRASYCRDRFCPQCAAARARMTARQIAGELEYLEARREKMELAFLTLTTRNVDGYGLADEVRRVLEAWRNMAHRAQMRNATDGWIRRMEITYNAKEGTHHVHVHALLLLHRDYFDDPKRYLSQEDFRLMWGRALGMNPDETLIVDVRRANPDSVDEIAKYATKPLEYGNDIQALADVVHAVRNKQMIRWGGEMWEARRAMDHRDEDYDGDDRRDVCPVCKTPLELIIYRWMGVEATYKVSKMIEK